MGIAADSLFNALMSWVRALVNALWALFSADRTTALEFLGKNWMGIAAVIIVCGLVIDWIVWLIRWQPYHIWARKIRRLLRLDEPEEEETKAKGKARAAVMPESRYARPRAKEEDERQTAARSDAQDEEAEMLRQMQEEARARARKEQEERMRLEREARAARLAQQAYEEEQARLAQQAYEEEQERLAQQAYEEEQAQLAQQEYERQMEEYERQKAQYERDLAEYERQKAEYEAQLAAQQADRLRPQAAEGASRRRRGSMQTQAAPAQETQVFAAQEAPGSAARTARKAAPAKHHPAAEPMGKKHEAQQEKNSGLLGRMAKMIEPEEEEIISRRTLPPRVNMDDAFRTAKLPVVTPPKNAKRRK